MSILARKLIKQKARKEIVRRALARLKKKNQRADSELFIYEPEINKINQK